MMELKDKLTVNARLRVKQVRPEISGVSFRRD